MANKWKACEGDELQTVSEKYSDAIRQLQEVFAQCNISIQQPVSTTQTGATIEDVVSVKISTVAGFPLSEALTKDIAIDVEIADNPNPTAVQPACELAIILDRSGSMSGSAIDNSKEAIVQIISKLKEQDMIHFISYSDDSQINFAGQMTQANKLEIIQSIESIEADGCTNIAAGILDAVKSIYRDNYVEHGKSLANRRVFIFSDGEVNEGISDRNELLTLVRSIQTNFGVNFTAFGLGSNFDEEVMKGIAHEGKGDFFFIDGPEDIANKVNKGMHVFQSLYAINAKLNLFASSSSEATVSISEVSGVPGKLFRSAVTAPVGDLCFDDLRQIMVFLQMDTTKANSNAAGKSVLILEYSLIYSVLTDDGSTQDFTKSGEISVVLSDNDACFEDVPNSLRVARAINEASSADKEILLHVQGGNFEEAIEEKKASIQKLKAVLPIDTTGVVEHLIKRNEVNLASLESQSDSVEKDIGYSAYQGSIVHRKCF